MAVMGDLPFTTGRGTVLVEWGSYSKTPDPYGIRTTELSLGFENNKVCSAAFSHNIVEILCEGKLALPGYTVKK